MLSNIIGTWPATVSFSPGALPRYGTWVRRTPAAGEQCRCRRGIAQRRAGSPGVVDQLLDGFHRQRRVDHQQIRHAHQHGDRRQVALGLVRQVGIQRRVDRDGADIAHHDGVAVGRLLDRVVGAQVAAGASLVLDDHGLLQTLSEFVADQPGQHVGRAARRVRHDPFDGLGGPGRLRADGTGGHRHPRHQRKRDAFHLCLLPWPRVLPSASFMDIVHQVNT